MKSHSALRLLDLATGVAISRLKHDQSFRLGSVGIRGSDGVIVASFNGAPTHPNWKHHSESRLSRKLTPDSVIAVVRIHADGKWAMSRPCKGCQICLKRVGVKRAYYSIAPGEYGVIDF